MNIKSTKAILDLWELFNQGKFYQAIEESQAMREALPSDSPEFWSTLEVEGFSALLTKGSHFLDLIIFRIKDCNLTTSLNLWFGGVSDLLGGLGNGKKELLEDAYEKFITYIEQLWQNETILSIDGVIFAFITKVELNKQYGTELDRYLDDLAKIVNVPPKLLRHNIVLMVLDVQKKYFEGRIGYKELEAYIQAGLPRKYAINLLGHCEIGDI